MSKANTREGVSRVKGKYSRRNKGKEGGKGEERADRTATEELRNLLIARGVEGPKSMAMDQ